MKDIQIENIGAVERLRIPLPPGGGVVVLTGRNGCGKSTALDSVSSLVSGKGKLSLKDGADRGSVSGFGARITLGSATRREGKAEAVVDHIESKFSISDLVDPGLDDPAAADKRRIKALVTLQGKEARPEMFEKLFGSVEEFNAVVTTRATQTTDPVEMAARVKSDIESQARIKEEQVKRRRAEYDAAIAGSEFDENDLVDLSELLDEMTVASEEAGRLRDQRAKAVQRQRQIDAAKSFLDDFDIAGKEMRRSELTAEIEESKAKHDALKTELTELHRQIKSLQDSAKIMEAELESSAISIRSRESSLKSLDSELETLERHKAVLAEDIELASVTDETVNEAEERSKRLRMKYNRAVLAHDHKKKRDAAQQLLESAEKLQATASRYRNAARDCDLVLTELIGADSVITVRDGRLLTETERGETKYSELSDGERWRVAFQVLAGRIRKSETKDAIITIPQIGWESLDPDNQQLVRDLAKEHGIYVVTAEATVGELAVETP